MMWGTIANLKENLNKIAQDVHDDSDEDELEIYNGGGGGSLGSANSDRRNSHSFAHSKSPPTRSPVSNGFGSGVSPEIEQYRAEIKRLQESEAEIKALSKNYAALLKEKEDQVSRLSKEYGSLKQNLDTTTASLNASRIENNKAATNGANLHKVGSQSPNRQHRSTGQAKTSYSGHQKQNGVVYTQDGNGIGNGTAHLSDMQGNEKTTHQLFCVLISDNR